MAIVRPLENFVRACAWCGNDPSTKKWGTPSGYSIARFKCSCPGGRNSNWLTHQHWNINQAVILERRRADFDAGRFTVVGSKPFSLYWPGFDDYLKAK